MTDFSTSNIHSISDLRQGTDLKIGPSLIGLGYKESHLLTDTRLALGYLSAAFAAGTFYIEKNFSFKDGFNYTAILVGLYFLVIGVIMLHSKFVEKDIIYRGSNKEGESLEIRGLFNKNEPIYQLTIKVTKKDGKVEEIKKGLKYTEIFDKFGNLHLKELQNWFKETLASKGK
ncbi:hypothetical protein WICPIJ_005163 [Wickerhamomyces pijperi]|uniref:Signal peptidase complex subunit 2 n=1 Tax=Wickerhamomyces pijperi TaxID=599730 RepID=A0A9P8Q6S1_WICPI|nr:hypothetical protein WICPIJ_005163 [Wickerhamomyces pijperi]